MIAGTKYLLGSKVLTEFVTAKEKISRLDDF